MSIKLNLQPSDRTADDPQARAREFVAFWYARWTACERLSDLPLEPGWLLPWSDDLAIFDLVDHGADFRLRQIDVKLADFLGLHGVETNLSQFPPTYRQKLRQVLLRASMIRAPAVEHYDWFVDCSLRSCLVCAMPVAGGLYRTSQLVLGIFHRSVAISQKTVSDLVAKCSHSEWSRPSFHSSFLPPSVSTFLPAETLCLGGGSLNGSAVPPFQQ